MTMTTYLRFGSPWSHASGIGDAEAPREHTVSLTNSVNVTDEEARVAATNLAPANGHDNT